MGSFLRFPLTVYVDAPKDADQPPAYGQPTVVPTLGWGAGEWVAHVEYGTPVMVKRVKGRLVRQRQYNLTHIPTSRWVAYSPYFFDVVIAVDLMRDLPLRLDPPPDADGRIRAGAIPLLWISQMVKRLGHLRLYIKHRPYGDLSIASAATVVANLRRHRREGV